MKIMLCQYQESNLLLAPTKTYVNSEFWDGYDIFRTELSFKFDRNGYLFLCNSYYMEYILAVLSSFEVCEPCSILRLYLDNNTDLSEVIDGNWIIKDKQNFIKNIEEIDLRLANGKHDLDLLISHDELIRFCKTLSNFIKDSGDNDLLMNYV